MKFSVLLPTYNGLKYLRYAVLSVLGQDYDDWEIIISDNCSEEDIEGYVKGFADSRIKYFRTERFLPVTDNWNNALAKADGDYIIMLGDDDCLMRGYFSTIKSLIEYHSDPEFIYTSAFLYAYPGVMPGFPLGFLKLFGDAIFFDNKEEPFWLNEKDALDLVKDFMKFKGSFGFNMQFFIISRNIITSLQNKGSFFSSPYPDFFAANLLFYKAKRILIVPYPLVTIGVCPKSHGFYYFNRREEEGAEFLGNRIFLHNSARLESITLPGSDYYTFWLLSLEDIIDRYKNDMILSIDYQRYRHVQIRYIYRQYFEELNIGKNELIELKSRMHLWERLVYGIYLPVYYRIIRLLNRKRIRKLLGRFIKRKKDVYIDGDYKNILEVFEHVG